MLQVKVVLKGLAVCATTIVLMQSAFAAVLILEGPAAPQPTPQMTPSPVEPAAATPAAPAAPIPPPAPTNSGILEPAAAPAAPSTPSNQPSMPPAAPHSAVVSDPAMISSDLSAVKVDNPAEVTVQMMPGETVGVGSRVSFNIRSKKSGYLVLIDVDATGHLTQIYPNTASLVRTKKSNANYIKAGATVRIPLATDPYAGGGVEYVVSPPNGQAMIVAILSAQPVQILDLPDLPPEVRNQSDALTFLAKWTNELRIPDDDTNKLREVRWSFYAKPYVIR